MAYARHQIRVRLRDRVVHSSGTNALEDAQERCRIETIYYGLGSIGTVYEYDKSQSPKPNEFHMKRMYEVRLVYDPDKSDGSTTLVHEDHTTPPPVPSPTPEHHV